MKPIFEADHPSPHDVHQLGQARGPRGSRRGPRDGLDGPTDNRLPGVLFGWSQSSKRGIVSPPKNGRLPHGCEGSSTNSCGSRCPFYQHRHNTAIPLSPPPPSPTLVAVCPSMSADIIEDTGLKPLVKVPEVRGRTRRRGVRTKTRFLPHSWQNKGLRRSERGVPLPQVTLSNRFSSSFD